MGSPGAPVAVRSIVDSPGPRNPRDIMRSVDFQTSERQRSSGCSYRRDPRQTNSDLARLIPTYKVDFHKSASSTRSRSVKMTTEFSRPLKSPTVATVTLDIGKLATARASRTVMRAMSPAGSRRMLLVLMSTAVSRVISPGATWSARHRWRASDKAVASPPGDGARQMTAGPGPEPSAPASQPVASLIAVRMSFSQATRTSPIAWTTTWCSPATISPEASGCCGRTTTVWPRTTPAS